jgi:LuxR family maltose regulon positive regulatory protein
VPAGALGRARLVARFDASAALVVALAPAGFGKTVAMAQWATATGDDGVWLRVREEETSPAAFVQSLAAELAAHGLLRDGNPLLLAGDALTGGAESWQLLRHGLRMLPGNLAVAIDGIDRLNDEATQGLLALVQDLSTLTVRATARRLNGATEPALPLVLDAETIEASELAVTAEEAAEIMGVAASAPSVADVLAIGGAPLVARAVATVARSDDGSAPVAAVSDVADSLIRLRLASEAWDDAFVEFLTVTSLAESITPQLAANLVAISAGGVAATASEPDAVDSAAGWLDRAETEGLGLWTERGGAESTFTFTPLVREAFERMLRTRKPALVRELDLAVARWELKTAQPFGALRRAVQCDDWVLASAVVRSYWNELLRNHGPQLRTLFRGTPLAVLRRQPLVTMLLALDLNRTGRHRLRALEYFALASHGARTQRARAEPADRALLRAIETAALRVSGKFDRALEAAIDGRDILLSMGPGDRDDLGRTEPTLHNQLGTTFFYAGRTEDALESFARSTAVGEARGLKAGLHGLALSAGTLAVAGDLVDARALIAEADGLQWPEGWITGYMGSFYQLAAAFVALEALDADRAETHLRSLDPHRETIEHWPLLAHAEALIGILRADSSQARLRLESEILRQRRRHALAPQTLARLAHTRSLVELADGQPAAAGKMIAKVPASARRQVALARIALAQALPEEALRLLLIAQDARQGDAHSSRSWAELLTLRAGALALLGDDDRAVAALEQASEFLAERQQGLALALVPVNAIDALLRVTERGSLEQHRAALTHARAHTVIPSVRPVPTLTSRETALALALPRVEKVTELSALLSVSPNTVKSQLQGLYRKLGVGNRADAIAALSMIGLIDPPSNEPARPSPEPFD